ncbi:hypothetical protein Acr_08g0008390 [Actinidia rufa]|uniref:Uncharacterized protein n=1 Tax=Actinidia rufa TaxID=165716 RepID=A0A7J0F1F1_9ERIC|nr:hypothetical protein Acr_08g0008390 [Actinidia rufa]
MASASVAENILTGVILPTDKERVDQLSLDQVITKLLHVLGQGVVLGSSLAIRSRDIMNDASFHIARAKSVEMEMARAQNRAKDLEGLLAEFGESKEARIKKLIVEKFKSSEDFQEAVEDVSSKYFSEGINFFKRRLAHHHPNLGIDLDGMDMDRDLLEKEEADVEEDKEKGEGKGDNSPLSP